MTPLVSVVIPAFNRAAYIRQAVESVLAQTHPRLEVIVVDDGSTDGTRGIVQAMRSADPRVRYIWQRNSERAVARNTGIKNSQGSYVAFLDSDDRWLPRKLEAQLKLMSADPTAVMAVCWFEQMDASGKSIQICKVPPLEEAQRPDFLCLLIQENRIGSPCPLIRREVFEEAGTFCLDPAVLCFEDWEMWTRIACFGKVVFIPQVLAQHRVHPGNTERPADVGVYLAVVASVLKHAPVEKRTILTRAATAGYWSFQRRSEGGASAAQRLIRIVGAGRLIGRGFWWSTSTRHSKNLCAVLLGNGNVDKLKKLLPRTKR